MTVAPSARNRLVLFSIFAALGIAGDALATAPTLRALSAYQSPVRAEGDDLLMIPGHGFAATDTVIYRAISDTGAALTAPTSVPTSDTASSGFATIVRSSDVPNSLTVRLPAVLQTSSSYALWVRNQAGEWSNGIRINDARPMWLSPGFAYATQSIANLPRYLKVIGRNLQPAPGQTTRVRLTGPQTLTLNAVNDANPATAIEHYVAQVNLPSSLLPGLYTVHVSRDGTSWTQLGPQFVVKPDVPAPIDVWNLADFGCAPNDANDDTACFVAALEAMVSNEATGPLEIGPGNWLLLDPAQIPAAKYRTYQGVIVPKGISLRGAGVNSTTITVGPSWSTAHAQEAAFTLLGDNTVSGINFVDQRQYAAGSHNFGMLKLGLTYYVANPNNPADPKRTSNVVITQNRFDKPYVAIHDDGLPMDNIFVTYNEIGAYSTGLALEGNGNNLTYPFQIDNSIFAYNIFRPGSSGSVIAAQFGAGRNVDVSHNTVDGVATQFLNNPSTDPRGWRAGFFWHMRNNHERLLIAQNDFTCTGDKGGDGEALAFDGNHNATGLLNAQPVLTATTLTVKVAGPLRSTWENHTLNTATYFNEHWIQVADGRGGGQVRKINSYTINPDSTITFTVSQGFETVPDTTSKITLSREYWQAYSVDNNVDHRTTVNGVPLCQKSNPTTGGVIGYWSPTADSTIEGNRQYDTSGIITNTNYSAEDASGGFSATVFFHSNLEIRGNVIDHEYDYNAACSSSGINANYGASNTPGLPPPIAAYGVSIARNTITQADSMHGGAISISRGWWGGPPPNQNGWELFNGPLVFQNSISNVVGPVPPIPSPNTCGSTISTRAGIRLYDGMIWNPVLYGNSCNNVTTKLLDGANGTVKVCPSPTANSCECP